MVATANRIKIRVKTAKYRKKSSTQWLQRQLKAQGIRRLEDVFLATCDYKNNLIIICINRNGKIIFPTGEDTIEVNDRIFISTTVKGIKGLNDILD